MYEKDEKDFSIKYDKKRNNYSIYIGTWTNYNQSFADALMYLEIKDKDKEKSFLIELKKYNKLLIINKENIIKDIQENGLNLYNICFSIYEIDEILSELEYQDKQEKILKDNEIYIINKDIDTEIEKEYKNDIIKAINESKNITELYKKLLIIKQEIKEYVFSNIYDFITTEKE